DLTRHVARTPRGNAEAVAVALEAERLEDLHLPLGWDIEPEHLVRPRRAQRDDRRLREVALDVHRTRPPRAGELDEQLRRERRRGLGEVRVDSLLPAVRPFGAQ